MSGIDNTWVGYALTERSGTVDAAPRLARVGSHYQEEYAEPLARESCGDGRLGMALWHRKDPRLRWPLWLQRGQRTTAFTNAPSGWPASGTGDLAAVADDLGATALSRGYGFNSLVAPFLIAAHDAGARRLAIANDALGAARLYEIHWPDGWAWSNRLGALVLFAGVMPRLDREAWDIHAATGWFLGRATPIEGITKVDGGSIINVTAGMGSPGVTRSIAADFEQLVGKRRARLRPQARAAAEATRVQARNIDAMWEKRPKLNLSGGRDSRVPAAAALAIGMHAKFRTRDIEPGEAQLVAEMLERSGAESIDHRVVGLEAGAPADDLATRLAANHHVHDGMANPMGVLTASVPLPWDNFPSPLITGHGGELGHGFYYSGQPLSELASGGFDGLVARLERSGRQKHEAASEAAYAAYRAEIVATLRRGAERGVEGLSLLDYFYLDQRLPHRTGMATRNDRYSACIVPEFIRGCFDLSPRQRLRSRFHDLVVGVLVPSWRRFPYFQSGGGPMRTIKRDRIWEKPRHSDELAGMIQNPGSDFDSLGMDRVREMWAEAKRGDGHAQYESIFMRAAWRISFLRHVELLGQRAAR